MVKKNYEVLKHKATEGAVFIIEDKIAQAYQDQILLLDHLKSAPVALDHNPDI